jgi:gliding motility-associated-like protein
LFRMAKQIKRIILLLWGFFLTGQIIFSQNHATRNNYTGDWETPTSWNPTWAVPQTTNINNNITIYGLITRNGLLIFPDNSANLIVSDTLVIKGDLTIGHNDHLTVSDNGILIIRGNLILDDDAIIDANGPLIVTGDIDKIGGTSHQYIRSNDNPVKIFIGVIIDPALRNKTWNPVLECTTEPSIPYPVSGCSYGTMADLMNDPIYPFFQSTCVGTPFIMAGGPTNFCSGDSVTLTSSTGISYLWSNGETLKSINVYSTGNYSVRVTNSNECQSAASAVTSVTVNALPAAPSISAGGPTTFCEGGVVTLTSGSGTSYLWSSSATTSSINVTVSGSYTVRVTNSNGCQSPSSPVTAVNVNTIPAVPSITASGPTTFCEGDSVNLSSGSGTNFLWSNGATSQSINVTLPGSYSVRVKNSSGCQSIASAAAIVSVNTLPPAPSITPGGPTTFCEGSAVTLTSGSGTSYLWSNGATSQGISITSPGNFNVRITNSSGCQSIASAITAVTVNALPAAPSITASGPATFCKGGNVILTSGSGESYLWSNGANTASINISQSGSYFVKVTSSNGCQSTASNIVVVTVNEEPVAIQGPDQELKYLFETKMAAELPSSGTGEWSLISGSGHIVDIHSPTTIISELAIGENIFLWNVKNGNCESGAKVKIAVLDLVVPSVITPDGDGKNDYFKISETNGPVELIIFNSWGNKEYSNSNYQNDWDGRNSRGAELPSDTYFYLMKFKNGKIIKGSVLIKR